MLTLLVLRPKYSERTKAIRWLPMPLLVVLPGHQQLRLGQCRTHKSLPSSMRNSSNHLHRDHFVYAPSHSETTLQCNIISHWLGAYTKWSLHTPQSGSRNHRKSKYICMFPQCISAQNSLIPHHFCCTHAGWPILPITGLVGPRNESTAGRTD